MGHPTIYPTGVTIYDPKKACGGYTLMPVIGVGAVLIDMNGEVIRNWIDLQGYPNKLLPGGSVMGHLSARDFQYGYQEQNDLVEVDWDGNILWQFNKKEIAQEFEQETWTLRQHHDYQKDNTSVGYFSGSIVQSENTRTLILTHETLKRTAISDKMLLDDVIIEVDLQGNIVWEWKASKHFREMDFSPAAKNALARNPNLVDSEGGVGNWLNINAVSYLGVNKWYEAGDERFHPDNIIWSSRQANIIAIISKKTGELVWKLGPDYVTTIELRRIGQIIGPNHAHMIPEGLPGAGNILIYDNGSRAGYGVPTNMSYDGVNCDILDRSRILELNPVTMEVEWELLANQLGYGRPGILDHRFYSPIGGSVQRLSNGNTLITESVSGRLFEITKEKEIVWEYYTPYASENRFIYRAFRYPYEYVPQIEKPEEIEIKRIDNKIFRVPGAAPCVIENVIDVEGTTGYPKKEDACVNKL